MGGADEIPIIKMGHKIKSKGVYNLEELYVELQLWFTHMGYAWHEVEYKKIAFPGGGYRLELIWIGLRKVDDYSSFKIKLILGADVSDKEVVLDGGKKVTRQKATLEFRSGAFHLRNRHLWKDWLFFKGKFLAKLYEFTIRDRIRQQEVEVWSEAHKLYDEPKSLYDALSSLE